LQCQSVTYSIIYFYHSNTSSTVTLSLLLLLLLPSSQQERTVRCRNCDTLYLASQNQSSACAYHSGTFKLACPRHCTALTPACMAHRARRWSCCDATSTLAWGKDGCRTRAHAPPLQVESCKVYRIDNYRCVTQCVQLVSSSTLPTCIVKGHGVV
jgi:hypothetical protein